MLNKHDHKTPYPGDHGIRFEPRSEGACHGTSPSSSIPEQDWTIEAVSFDTSFLIHTSDELETPSAKARVLDLDQGILFPEFAMYSIVARGYWDEYKGPQDILPELLSKVKRADTPSDLKRLLKH